MAVNGKTKERAGIMLYKDTMQPILTSCTMQEIGILISALFASEYDPDTPFPVEDRMLQFAFETLKASNERDRAAYIKKCCTNAVVALFKQWKSERKAAGCSSLPEDEKKDIFFGEMVNEINGIRERYEYYDDINF